jgi:hypothetical protein
MKRDMIRRDAMRRDTMLRDVMERAGVSCRSEALPASQTVGVHRRLSASIGGQVEHAL